MPRIPTEKQQQICRRTNIDCCYDNFRLEHEAICCKIKSITIFGSSRLPVRPYLLIKCKNDSIKLDRCPNEFFRSLRYIYPNLTNIEISNCQNILKIIRAMVGFVPDLTALDITGPTNIDHQGDGCQQVFKAICLIVPRLEVLTMKKMLINR